MDIRHARAMAKLLDNQFEVFGFKFGLDPIIGLIPGFGDVMSLILSGVIIKAAIDMKIPQKGINQMIANVVLDFIIGSIPFLGDIGDFFYQVNKKNLAILESFVSEKEKIIEGEIVG